MMELTREQVEELAERFPVDILYRYKNALLAHDAALRQRAYAAENELCTAKDQIPPDLDGYPLSVVLIKLNDERRVLRQRAEAAERKTLDLMRRNRILRTRTDLPMSHEEKILYRDLENRLAQAEARVRELEDVCAQAYQVVGVFAYDSDRFDEPQVQGTLDNLSGRSPICETLPFESKPTKLTWTTDKPTVAGGYWYRLNREAPAEVLVLIHGSHYKLEVNCQGDTELKNYTGEWAGPIQMPKEGV